MANSQQPKYKAPLCAYNDSCPDGIELGQPAHALTGCVATAMAQVMKYWNYPERGTGSHTYYSSDIIGISNHGYGEPSANFGATVYDWSNMPDSLTLSSPSLQKAAVATLMYHCGVACDTHYGSERYGSGSKIINIPYLRLGNALNGMIKYFGYSSSATGMERAKYDDSSWTALVRGELDNYSSGGVLIDNLIIERVSGVGIQNIATAQTLTVYPNPTNGHITIEGVPEGSRIELYDATGSLVMVSTNRYINISNCPAGVYILCCTSSDGVVTRRVIKR